jgi:hypothetical protein
LVMLIQHLETYDMLIFQDQRSSWWVVNDDDRTIIGNPNPDLLVNFNGSLEYKGFDLIFYSRELAGVDRLLMKWFTHAW